MKVDVFNFDLPEELIALRPISPKESAQLLSVDSSGIKRDCRVSDLVSLLRTGDALVLNNTRVIPARLKGYRIRNTHSASITATLHRQIDSKSWRSFVKPSKRLQVGDQVVFLKQEEKLLASVEEKNKDGEVVFCFEKSGYALDQALSRVGHVPLPPYISSKRAEDAKDIEDYQTIYARYNGAVAAPTAGLHFTEKLLSELKAKDIEVYFITLHVGAGTFLPMKAERTEDHEMHEEWGSISLETACALNKVKKRGSRIIAVGTTSLRCLESASQENGELICWQGLTNIFITPGYRFKVVDLLMTNFHLPKSTLFMLISAFCGLERAHSIYKHAIKHRYRFYSYGDTSLLERAEDG